MARANNIQRKSLIGIYSGVPEENKSITNFLRITNWRDILIINARQQHAGGLNLNGKKNRGKNWKRCDTLGCLLVWVIGLHLFLVLGEEERLRENRGPWMG